MLDLNRDVFLFFLNTFDFNDIVIDMTRFEDNEKQHIVLNFCEICIQTYKNVYYGLKEHI